ncbi:unnamed protein product [Closterium sp. Naga37s-1]|nr:unnamed protein product [Closterium sp. Naga37s-1]
MVIPSYNDMLDGLEAKRQGRPSTLVMEMTIAALGHFKKYVYASSDDLLIATFLDPATRERYFALGTRMAAEGSLYPTISMVIPSYNDMLDGLEAKRQGRPSTLVMEMTVAALRHFKKYVYANNDDLLIATFLDPATREGYFALGTWENRHPELVSQGGGRRARGPVMVDEILILVRTRVEAYRVHAAVTAPPPATAARAPATDTEGDEHIGSRAAGGARPLGDEVDRYVAHDDTADVPPLDF